MDDREPRQWAELLEILRKAKQDFKEAVAAEKPVTEGLEYIR